MSTARPFRVTNFRHRRCLCQSEGCPLSLTYPDGPSFLIKKKKKRKRKSVLNFSEDEFSNLLMKMKDKPAA